MINFKNIIKWTNCVPYIFTVFFFIALTFPGANLISFHLECGYLFFALIGSAVVGFLHFGIIYLVKQILRKYENANYSVLILIERFNIFLGIFIVIMFDGFFTEHFTYRKWAYGVIKAESVLEKVSDEWNSKQIVVSKNTSAKINNSVQLYTAELEKRWNHLKEK